MADAVRKGDQPPVYVIHLAHNADRRPHMETQLRQAGISHYTFVAATDGHALSESERKSLVVAPKGDFKRSLHPGEIGCYISHIRTMERIQKEQHPCAVILEDDILLNPDFGQVLPYLAACPIPWHFIHLVHPHKQRKVLYKWRTIPLLKPYRVATSLFKISTTGGYMVSQKGLNAVLPHAWPIRQPIDRFLFMHENNTYFMHLVLPPLVTFSALNDESNIRRPLPSPAKKRAYYMGRLKYYVSLLIWTFFSFLPIPKRMHRHRRNHNACAYYAWTLYDFLFRRNK